MTTRVLVEIEARDLLGGTPAHWVRPGEEDGNGKEQGEDQSGDARSPRRLEPTPDPARRHTW
jgi:hypothetical protein